MFKIEPADRIKALPPYLFKELDRLREEAVARGVDVINLGIGDPDSPTPNRIIERMAEEIKNPAHHQYPSYVGMKGFRTAVAGWYDRRFGVELNPDDEVIALIGSKEGLAHIPLAFINPGDVALIPEPAYPVYSAATMFAGGVVHYMPLKEENGFLPDLSAVDEEIAKKAKIMFVNYPNNPTGAAAEPEFYERVVKFAQKHEIIVIADSAYTEMNYEGYEAPSFMAAPGAKEVGVEFHSLSKTYNMTGWRIAWACGRPDIVDGLGRIKSNVDSGAFQAIQAAAIEALEGDQSELQEMRAMYTRRRDVLVNGLIEAGFKVKSPKATFFIWVPIPEGYSSADFSSKLLTETGVIVTPGAGFGPSGEGYIRFALTKDENRLREAVERIKKLKL